MISMTEIPQDLPKTGPHNIDQITTQHLSHRCLYESRKRCHRRINLDPDVLIVRCSRSCDFFFIMDCPVYQFTGELHTILPSCLF